MPFTYQKDLTGNTLETYEWDNIWWEHAPDNKTPRILAIGDSISCGWRTVLNRLLNGTMYVDGFGSSKALDNPHLLPSIELMASQQPQCSIVLFNNGLHGFHLSTESYQTHYAEVLGKLKAMFPEQRLFVLLTTPVYASQNPPILEERTEIARQRNAAASEIAASMGIPVIDLFSAIIDHPELYSNDGVHLVEAGYELLAKEILQNIL